MPVPVPVPVSRRQAYIYKQDYEENGLYKVRKVGCAPCAHREIFVKDVHLFILIINVCRPCFHVAGNRPEFQGGNLVQTDLSGKFWRVIYLQALI